MNRQQEIDQKHRQLNELLRRRKAKGIWLRRRLNVAWITAGLEPSIDLSSENGSYGVFISPERRAIVTNNIELPRLIDEERIEDLGFEPLQFQWYQQPTTSGMDGILTDDGEIEEELQKLRWVLLPTEQDRYRTLGADTAAALAEVARSLQPGQTERQIAQQLEAACAARDGRAVVSLVGVDGRIERYRHPLPTETPLRKYAMLVVCMRRGGLIASATRLVYLGRLTDELDEKMRKMAFIDATVIGASRPGRTLGDAFADLQTAYAKSGEADQWKKHHQGGLTGYRTRERLATPGDSTRMEAGQALAWNPSVVGCKSEDTILLTEQGFEILTQAQNWPMIRVEIGKHTIPRPAILELT